MLARLLYGGRLSLLIGGFAVAIGLIVGVPLGALSGFQGGLTDLLIQRLATCSCLFQASSWPYPWYPCSGVGLQNVIMPSGSVPSRRSFAWYVALSSPSVSTSLSRQRGLWGSVRTLSSYVMFLPNAMAPIIVQATLNLGASILVAAGLGFLGLGVQPPTAEWGTMLGEGAPIYLPRPSVNAGSRLSHFSGCAWLYLLGDGLRDALDPRLPQF